MITTDQIEAVARALRLHLEKSMPKNMHAVIVLYDDDDDTIAILSSEEIDREALLAVALRNIRDDAPDRSGVVSRESLGKKLH